jgi:hypothetical protein
MTHQVRSSARASKLATTLFATLVVTLTATLVTVPLGAHHSYAGFEQDHTVFVAQVESLTIENPHTLIKLKGTDGQRYLIVYLAATALGRMFPDGAAGLTSRMRVGDSITVSGRLKRGADIIEVVATQMDDAKGEPIGRGNRPPLVKP